MNGPRLRVIGNQRAASALLGIPVRTGDDTGRHTADCYWCDGALTVETCPRSIELRGYVERRSPFRPHPPTCRRCGNHLGDCLGHQDDPHEVAS